MTKSIFRAAATGYWPLSSMMKVMDSVYDSVEILAPSHDEKDIQYARISANGLNFLSILINAPDEPEKIMQFGFVAMFQGFELSQTGVESLNRSLHISIVELDDKQNLILMSLLEANGAFDEAHFALVLQAWSRDVIITLKMLSPGASFHGALSGKALNLLNTQLANRIRPETVAGMKADFSDGAHIVGATQRTNPEQATPHNPQEMLERFLGQKDASRQLCSQCEGRGKTGWIAKACTLCQGSGLTKPTV